MRPGGAEADFEDYDDFDGDGFFLGDVNELIKKPENIVFPKAETNGLKIDWSGIREVRTSFFILLLLITNTNYKIKYRHHVRGHV